MREILHLTELHNWAASGPASPGRVVSPVVFSLTVPTMSPAFLRRLEHASSCSIRTASLATTTAWRKVHRLGLHAYDSDRGSPNAGDLVTADGSRRTLHAIIYQHRRTLRWPCKPIAIHRLLFFNDLPRSPRFSKVRESKAVHGNLAIHSGLRWWRYHRASEMEEKLSLTRLHRETRKIFPDHLIYRHAMSAAEKREKDAV